MGLFNKKTTTDFTVPILQQIQQEEESKSARQIKAEEKALEKKKKKKGEKNNAGANVIYEDYDDEDDVEVVAARNHQKVTGDVPGWVSESSARKEETVTETFDFDEPKKDSVVKEESPTKLAEEMEPAKEPESETSNSNAQEAEITKEAMVITAEPVKEIDETKAETTVQTIDPSFLQKDFEKEEESRKEESVATKLEPAMSVHSKDDLGSEDSDDDDASGLELDLGDGQVFDFPMGNRFPSNAKEPVPEKNLNFGLPVSDQKKDDDEEEVAVIPDLVGKDDDEEEDDMSSEGVSVSDNVVYSDGIKEASSAQNDWEEEPGMMEALESQQASYAAEVAAEAEDLSLQMDSASVSEVREAESASAINAGDFENQGAGTDEDLSGIVVWNDTNEEVNLAVCEDDETVAEASVASVLESDSLTAEEAGRTEMAAEIDGAVVAEELNEEEQEIAFRDSADEEKEYAFDMEEEETPATEAKVVVSEETSQESYSYDMDEEASDDETAEMTETTEASDSTGYSFEFEEGKVEAEQAEEVKGEELPADDGGYNAEMEEAVSEAAHSEDNVGELFEEGNVESSYSYDMEEECEEEDTTFETEALVEASAEDLTSAYSSEMEYDETGETETAKSVELTDHAIETAAAGQEESAQNGAVLAASVLEAEKHASELQESEGYRDDMEDSSADGDAAFATAQSVEETAKASETLQEEAVSQMAAAPQRPRISFEDDEEEETKQRRFMSPIPFPKFQRKEKPEKEEARESDVLRRYRNKRFVSNAVTTAIGLASIIVCFGVAVKTTVVASGSMEPTLMTGDVNVYNRLAYVVHDVQRGDVITFWSKENKEYMSKRIIGVAGDHVEFHDGYVFINGLLADESQYLDEDVETNCSKSFDVPDGCVFVLGDNRENSIDSRFFADPYISEDDIIGKYLGSVPRIW